MGEQLTSISIALSTLGILGVTVKFFAEFIKAKEASMDSMIERFNTTIQNHLTEHTEHARQTTDELKRLGSKVESWRGCEYRAGFAESKK